MAIVKIGNAFRGSEEAEHESTSGSSDSETEISGSSSGTSESESDSSMGRDEPEVDRNQPVEPGTDLYQVSNQTCTLPDDLYDLDDLSEILSVDTWNNCLSEEERFALSRLLPDLDRETFAHTLSDLFAGKNFHFGSPMSALFTQLKGGLCDPNIVLYKRSLKFLQRRNYYHNLQNYHNSFIGNLVEIRETWENCKGYKIQERLNLLNTLRAQKLLGYEENEFESESDTDSEQLKYYLKNKHKSKLEMDMKSSNNKSVLPEPVKIKGCNNYKKPNPNQAVTVASYGYDKISKKGNYLEKSGWVNNNHSNYDKLDPQTLKNSYKNNGLKISRGKVLKQKDETESDSSGQTKQANNFPIKRDYNEISREAEVLNTKGKKKSKLIESTSNQEVQLVKRVYIPVSSNNVRLPPVESYTLERKIKPLSDPDPDPVNFTKIKQYNMGNNEGFIRKSGFKDYAENPVHVPSLASCTTKKSKGKNINNNNNNNIFAQMDNNNYNNDFNNNNLVSEETSSNKKKGKRKLDLVSESEKPNPDSVIPVPDPEPEKPIKKPHILITPTIHTGFSFSIIHLLSAVRKAMISPLEQDNNNNNNNKEEKSNNLPSLTVQEIVNRVKKNPGDPFILETQEPLQDLVRGVLRIFSSKTAPLGCKGWKPLVCYQRPDKTWTWIGPISPLEEEETSSDAWAIPHKMLVKLVDSFANWLKSGQETLQQIGSLPDPPPAPMESSSDQKERFKDLRAQKSLSTITPSSDEFRAYFRKEEVLRYSIPDRAFSYTGSDGKKTIVAPLRRGGGKPTSKARDHFMLKPDRPPHVTILCLVRDAAARLPGSIGTRADVCTLLRDSQYIVEDVSDAQVNQVVSGALDRLHYERDPCVQFDGERKLWVYLHREREEEDFEDDGTSSTKKWRRPRKDDNGSGFDLDADVADDKCHLADGKESIGTAAGASSGTGTSSNAGTSIQTRVGNFGTGAGSNTGTSVQTRVGNFGTGAGTNSNTGTGTGIQTRVGAGLGLSVANTGGGNSSSNNASVANTRVSTGISVNNNTNTKTSTVGVSRVSGGIQGGGGTSQTGTSMGMGMGGTGVGKMVCHENSMNDDFDDEEYGGGERLFGAILL